jgi:hypothetical protein
MNLLEVCQNNCLLILVVTNVRLNMLRQFLYTDNSEETFHQVRTTSDLGHKSLLKIVFNQHNFQKIHFNSM